MAVEQFAARLAKVRDRFITAIEAKIEDTYTDLPKLAGEGRGVTEALEKAYRRIHGIVGIGPTVGFPATGKSAKAVENVLLGPYRASRGLVSTEVDALKTALHVLREAAQRELQITYTGWR